MAKEGNALLAAFDEPTPAKAEDSPSPAPRKRTPSTTAAKKPSRQDTVLVGAHFPASVQKQLRMIAAEEGTTNRALIEEALNMLFVKKGKTKIV